MTGRWVGGLALAGALAAAPSAAAAPGFARAAPVGNGVTPAAAMAGDGSAFVAYAAPDGSGVFSVRRSPGARSFSDQARIGGQNVVAGSLVAAREGGTAAVAWTERDGAGTRVRLAVAAPAFGEPETVPGAAAPSLALNAAGDLMLGFAAGGQGAVAVRPAGGALGAPRPVPGATSAPQVAPGPAGWRAVWHETAGNAMRAADAGPDGALAAPTLLSLDTQPADGVFHLAHNRAGDLVAAWTANIPLGGGAQLHAVEAATRPADGPWTAGAPVAGVPAAVPNVRAAINDAGDAVIGWSGAAADGTGFETGTVFRPAAGVFGEAAAIREGTEVASPVAVAMDAGGGSLLARSRAGEGEARTAVASLRERDGTLGREKRLAAAQPQLTAPTAAADGFGNAIVAYSSTAPGNPVSVAAYGRAAPEVSDVALSRTGLTVTASEPGRLSVTITRLRDDAQLVLAAPAAAGGGTVTFSKRQQRFVRRGGRYRVRIDTSDAGPGERKARFRVRRS